LPPVASGERRAVERAFESDDRLRNDYVLYLDAEDPNRSSIARYLNHSSSPTLVVKCIASKALVWCASFLPSVLCVHAARVARARMRVTARGETLARYTAAALTRLPAGGAHVLGPRAAHRFEAARRVRVGEELTFDYGPEYKFRSHALADDATEGAQQP
jgi:hypothetical protein